MADPASASLNATGTDDESLAHSAEEHLSEELAVDLGHPEGGRDAVMTVIGAFSRAFCPVWRGQLFRCLPNAVSGRPGPVFSFCY